MPIVRIDDAKERINLLVKSASRFPIDENFEKIRERYAGRLDGTNVKKTLTNFGLSLDRYFHYYSTKRKSVGNPLMYVFEVIS